jgi:hypothetical protein
MDDLVLSATHMFRGIGHTNIRHPPVNALNAYDAVHNAVPAEAMIKKVKKGDDDNIRGEKKYNQDEEEEDVSEHESEFYENGTEQEEYEEDNPTKKKQNRKLDEALNFESNLPNYTKVKGIIESMSKFQFETLLPPNLIYKPSKEDKDLENNIRQLFNPRDSSLWDLADLQDIIPKIVQRDDALMHSLQKKRFKHGYVKMDKSQRDIIKLFYPNLV